ncbi:MAG: IS200/IS605 family transposase [Desulfitobacteriaceae bacterium]|nr:IS200/IS605 family transposase [Desulfitobacteriaceae bacterium]MDI6878992.1 IS200/IS605 family transposase [Desulfitobacteriaceae bacterium]MDI6916137.1 IS200/IS605 family transposase [Desulfitobacteriaceae bacterium]
MEIKHGRGYVYALRYHLVFCVKYRHALLTDMRAERLKKIFRDIATEHKFEIITMEVMPDHVHLLLDCSPQHFIPDIVKTVKGYSARLLFKEMPELKKRLWGGHLWNPSYFVTSVSEVSETAIRQYIESQKERGEQDV